MSLVVLLHTSKLCLVVLAGSKRHITSCFPCTSSFALLPSSLPLHFSPLQCHALQIGFKRFPFSSFLTRLLPSRMFSVYFPVVFLQLSFLLLNTTEDDGLTALLELYSRTKLLCLLLSFSLVSNELPSFSVWI